ncbi:MAG TPA: cobalt ECF transporter T component CbiQ [Gemmatales bacterium]|nr:cobalt ECF transporter T component CbiQ [Gemmatales bacterium]HMP58283.1 cobalt ECF transporter T component CbiQ [Gemmatales bacterium]
MMASEPTQVPGALGARLDPRAKLAALAVVVFGVGLCPDWRGVALAAGVSTVAVAFLAPDWREWARRLASLTLLALAVVLLLPLTGPGPYVQAVGLHWSPRGCELAALLLGKMLAMFNAVWLLSTTTPLSDLLAGLARLGLPRQGVALVGLTIRYVHLFELELQRLRLALRTRGFRNRFNRHGWRTAAVATGSLLLHGLDRAERVAQAWQTRGWHGVMPQRPLPGWSAREALLLAVAVLLGVLPWAGLMGSAWG